MSSFLHFRAIIAALALLLPFALIWAQGDEINCGTSDTTRDADDFPTRGTVRAAMVWAGVWDTVRNVGACPGQSDSFWTPFPSAPPWHNYFFDPSWPYSLVNYVKTYSDTQFVLDADTNDVYVRDRATRERYNYYQCPSPKHVYKMHWNYAQLLLAEIDEDIDFSQYDANNDGGVDLVIFMMDFPFDGGEAHGAWYQLVPDTLEDTIIWRPTYPDYTTNDVNASGDSMVIQQRRTLIVWVDSRSEPNLWKLGRWNGLLTHEFSHIVGVDHEYPVCGCGPGAFTLMTGPVGFADPDEFVIPSPYLPAITTGYYSSVWGSKEFYYSMPDCVVISTQNISLRDYQDSGDAMMIVPEQSNSYTGLEYFLVTNHQSRSPFERNWPGVGLLITHVLRSAGFTERPRKRYDLELPMGLWNWAEAPGNCNIGFRTQIPNPISGLDSMDYRYTLVGDTEIVEFYPLGPGSAGCFWQAAQEFTPTTNPNTNLYIAFSQSKVSHIRIEGIEFDPSDQTFTMDAYTARWAGTYSGDIVWYDTVKVVGNLTIAEGATLTIEPGTVVRSVEGAYLDINGTLSAVGDAEDPIIFEGLDGARWEGIYVSSSGQITLQWCSLAKADDGIFFSECQQAQLVENCTITDMTGAGIYAFKIPEGNLTVKECTIENCQFGIEGSLSSGFFDRNSIVNCDSAGIFWTGDYPGDQHYPFFFGNNIESCGLVSSLAGGISWRLKASSSATRSSTTMFSSFYVRAPRT